MSRNLNLNLKTKNSTNNSQSAFTIVELLVVIVIIGILATIVIIFYIGTHDKAIDSSLQADLKGASTVLELDKANGDLYPSTKENANDGKGLKSSSGTTFDYAYSSGNNSYCLTASKEGRSYYIDSANRVPTQGDCSFSIIASSFTRTWGGNDVDYANSITKTSDGGYAIAGVTESYDAAGQNAFLAKYTADGTLSWSKTWSGTNYDGSKTIIQTNDGGYAISGGTVSYGAGGSDAFLAKFTADGTLSWNKTWGGNGADSAASLIQTSTGEYVITGGTDSFGYGSYDAFLAKYSSNGDLLWSKTWGGDRYDTSEAVIQNSDGGYTTAGMTYSYGSGFSDAFLAKYTADGTLSWSKTWSGDGYDFGSSLAKTNDNGYVLTGTTGGNVFLAKYTTDGTLSWSKTWGGSGYNQSSSITQTNDGGYAVSGNTTGFGVGSEDVFLAKYTTNGTLSWSKTWGGSASEYGYSMIQNSDGSYAITGATNSYGSGDSDAFLIKYNTNGFMANCPASMCQSPSATSTDIYTSVKSPTVTTTNPAAITTNPTATTTNPAAITTNPTANTTGPSETQPVEETEPTTSPEMTITFSNQELYIGYPGEDQVVCKEWSAPNGSQIKGFKVSQESEDNYDYFSVLIDDVEKYNKSGVNTDEYIDTASSPGSTLKACMSADSSVQVGFGGEVTGVFYN